MQPLLSLARPALLRSLRSSPSLQCSTVSSSSSCMRLTRRLPRTSLRRVQCQSARVSAPWRGLSTFQRSSALLSSDPTASPLAADDPSEAPMDVATSSDGDAPEHVVQLVDQVLQLNMLEMKQFIDTLGRKMGVPEGMMSGGGMMMGGGMMGGGGMMPQGGAAPAGGDAGAAAPEPVEEKTHVDIKLSSFDAKSKIKVIKEVRALTGLGLKQAKELVESAPASIKDNVKREEAEEIASKLKELGAEVELA